ncbi:MAG TPA: hypothetical protein VNR86_06950 [Sphingomicrobium sp.]|nr:hypothetical protein [Sphingomicrobium sp.]
MTRGARARQLTFGEKPVALKSAHIHIMVMMRRDQWRKLIDHPVVEWSLFALGLVLLLVSPLVGAIPGPGGIIVAGIGLALVLKTSAWAKRRYVRFKRWQPRAGRWTDWALRRPSAQRREALRKGGDEAVGN